MLSDDDILSVIDSELSESNGGVQLKNHLETSLNYYMGEPNGKEVDGLSAVTSTDVADAIEWILPQIMKSFTQNNEIVIFDPVHEGDEKQAELESEYVYEVLMKQNDGFIILHQFVKDALMQRNGILKCYYAKHKTKSINDYTGIGEEQFQAVLSAENIELLQKSEYIDEDATEQKKQALQAQIQQGMEQLKQATPEQQKQAQPMIEKVMAELEKPVLMYDIKISMERSKGQIYVDPVPPEEFSINSQHNSINPNTSRFTAHTVRKPISDIIEEYDMSLKDVRDLPEGYKLQNREYRFSYDDDTVYYDSTSTKDISQKLIEVSECYMKIDVDEVGISKMMKIDVAGGDTATDILSKDEIDSMPWISTTAFLMSHKFEGRSITDRLMEIQDQKTALWRNMFDNMYLQNNQRNIVVENQVNMDDLLVSRPGGIVRAKRTDAIVPLVTPQLGQDAYNMMEYLDKIRAARTGVDADGAATPNNVGDNVGSQGVDRLMNAKEELVGLIIRVIAETGIKPLCMKIRDLSCKHVDAIHDFRFRGVWYKVNPKDWGERTRCTVRVGTGTGNHQLQVAALSQVMMIQEKLVGNVMIDDAKTFSTIDDFCKFSGLNGAVRYFLDPSSEEGKAKKKSMDDSQAEEKKIRDEMEMAIAQSQLKVAEAETVKAKAQADNVQLKAEIDSQKNQLTNQKQMLDAEIDSLKQQLEEAKIVTGISDKEQDRILKKYETDSRTAVELTRIEKDSEKDENANFEGNKESVAS